jgi:hypothetical protein
LSSEDVRTRSLAVARVPLIDAGRLAVRAFTACSSSERSVAQRSKPTALTSKTSSSLAIAAPTELAGVDQGEDVELRRDRPRRASSASVD